MRQPRQPLQTSVKLHTAQAQFHHCQARYRGFVGGRGAGKSWIGAYDMVKRAMSPEGRGRLYLVAAPTYPMLSDSSIRTTVEICRMLGVYNHDSLKRQPPSLLLPNNSEILFRSADDPERLRGPNLSGVWLDEASLMSHEAYTVAIATLRERGQAGWLSATFTPKGLGHWTYDTFATGKPDTALIRAQTKANPFLDAGFITALEAQYSDRTALQELSGEFVDSEGAEWPAEHFGPHIWWNGSWPQLQCKVIAVDPSKGREAKQGDFSAIVMLGRTMDGALYVDSDMVRVNTEVLVDMILERQREFNADLVVIEANQFQELIAVQLMERARGRGMAIPCRPIVNVVNKLVRIRRLGPYLSQRLFRFRETPHNKIIVEQMRDFPTASHDDGPDALEMALRCMIELHNGRQGKMVTRLVT